MYVCQNLLEQNLKHKTNRKIDTNIRTATFKFQNYISMNIILVSHLYLKYILPICLLVCFDCNHQTSNPHRKWD